jgi:hypothetical protein
MAPLLLELSGDDPRSLRVLFAYASAEQVAPPVEPTDDESGWVPRLRDVDGVPPESLAPLHGRLIAHGYLRFVLLGRSAGVAYRVTPEGRALLRRIESGGELLETAEELDVAANDGPEPVDAAA